MLPNQTFVTSIGYIDIDTKIHTYIYIYKIQIISKMITRDRIGESDLILWECVPVKT